MHPSVRIMQRYIEHYCNAHDVSVCAEIMSPDYVVHIAGREHRGRDDRYVPAAAKNFAAFDDLRLYVHELHSNGDHMVMRFSERGTHGATGQVATWAGIGLYRIDEGVLVSNWVAQDYQARSRQLEPGASPDALDTVPDDPWDVAVTPADPAALAVATAWLQRGRLTEAAAVVIDDSWLHGPATLALEAVRVRIDEIFSVGSVVAAHVGLGGSDGHELNVAALMVVRGGAVASVRAVTDRAALAQRRGATVPAGLTRAWPT
jgi:ketosteroid isomerase-like protein